MRIKSSINILQNGLLVLLLSIFLLSSCGNESQKASKTVDSAAQPEVRISDTSAILTSFNFEHFGSYDLSTWKLMPKVDQGDVVLEVTTYTKDGSKIDIEESDMGQDAYFLTYKLTGPDGKVSKTRNLSLENDLITITETVNDYTINPAKQFKRVQQTGKPRHDLKPLPTTATGSWTEGPADELE
jgi:hypothetical protein